MKKEYKSELDPIQLELFPFDEVADRLTVRLLNPEHTDILDQVPYREICGIVEVCCLSVKADETGKSFLTVTNRMAEAWGISEEALFRAAEEASARNNPATLRPLLSVLHNMTCGGEMPGLGEKPGFGETPGLEEMPRLGETPDLFNVTEASEIDLWKEDDSMAGDGLWNGRGTGAREELWNGRGTGSDEELLNGRGSGAREELWNDEDDDSDDDGDFDEDDDSDDDGDFDEDDGSDDDDDFDEDDDSHADEAPDADDELRDDEDPWDAEELTLAQETAENQLYIATNSDSVLGAGVIMYPGFLKKAAKVLGGNFYLLPSSIHEFLFLPDTGDCDYENLNDMVKTINENEVTLREQLSDRVLYYDCRKEELREPGTYLSYSFTEA